MPPQPPFSSSSGVKLPLKKISRACITGFVCLAASVCQFALPGNARCELPSETTVQVSPVGQSTRLTDSMQKFFSNVCQYFGTRYQFGGQTPRGFDCSGFVRFMYDKVFNMHLPRSSKEMSAIGNKVNMNELQPGDLVFFQTKDQRINHVGIFIGNDTFVHSSLTKGITEDKLKLTYYGKRFAGAVRLLDPIKDKLPPLPLQPQESENDITEPS